MSSVRTLVDAAEHTPVVRDDRRLFGRGASRAERVGSARRSVRVGAVAVVVVGLALVTGTAEVAAAPHGRSLGIGVFGWQGAGGAAGEAGAGEGVTVALVDTGVSDTQVLDRASGRLVDGVDTSPLLRGESPHTTGRFADGYSPTATGTARSSPRSSPVAGSASPAGRSARRPPPALSS